MKLGEYRKSIGMSTSEAAHRLGVAQSTVVRLEQSERAGTVTIQSLQKFAAALGVQFSYTIVGGRPFRFPRKYKGLKRVRTKKVFRTGALGKRMTKEVARVSKKLSLVKRIQQSCALSDLAYEMRSCLAKRS